jgi:hypothetical protein
MSPRYSQSAGGSQPASGQPADEDRRSFTTGIGSMVSPAADETDAETAAPPRPTFTAIPERSATGVPGPTPAPDDTADAERTVPGAPALGPDDGAAPERTIPDVPALAPDDGAPTEPGVMPGVGPVAGAGPAPADALAADDGDRTRPQPLPAAAGLEEPLLGDVPGLRARWQRVQAAFVDDPREAVGEAADLIDQTTQAMIGALRQRQQRLRAMWEDGAADGSARADGGSAAHGSDTEHLRQMMRHYRTLFNQLCQS